MTTTSTSNHLVLGPGNSIYFEYDPPNAGGKTLVFVNALTGNTGAWQSVVAPRCRAAGMGTLCWNFRGQVESQFSEDKILDADLITADLIALIEEIAPQNPVLVGLSIGGLFASRAILSGIKADGLVLLNTLRIIGPRIAWINDAMLAAVRTGGFPLLLDLYLPLLTNEDFQRDNRAKFLDTKTYTAENPANGHFKLMEAAGSADWDVPYQNLDLPILTVTGLQDRLFLDMNDVAELRTRFKNDKHLEWDDAGHLLPLEHPVRLAEALIEFSNGFA